MTVRCKFSCREVKESGQSDDAFYVTLDAVYDPDPESENGRFFKYTPSGTLALGTINASAAAQFEIGKEYYLDISLAE